MDSLNDTLCLRSLSRPLCRPPTDVARLVAVSDAAAVAVVAQISVAASTRNPHCPMLEKSPDPRTGRPRSHGYPSETGKSATVQTVLNQILYDVPSLIEVDQFLKIRNRESRSHQPIRETRNW